MIAVVGWGFAAATLAASGLVGLRLIYDAIRHPRGCTCRHCVRTPRFGGER